MNVPFPRGRFGSLALAISLLCSLLFASAGARADELIIKRPGDHPKYTVELEPHGILGLGAFDYGSVAIGAGGRVGIPIVQNGFIPTLNNSVAISFGADWAHFLGCYDSLYSCSADYLEFPVTMQWNFFLTRSWSVFGEPGFYIYHGWFNNCPVGCGTTPTATGAWPAFYAGARYHFSDKVTLTMRIGYPTFSIGVSFLE
jgi:hypothetical protein